VYTAPSVVPDGLVTIRAASLDDPRGVATATIRVIVGAELTAQTNLPASEQGVANTLSGGQRSLALDGSRLYAVWSEIRNGNEDVYLGVSHDRGRTMASVTRLNTDGGIAPQQRPTVAVDGSGRVVIAWVDGRNYPLITPQPYDVYVTTASWNTSGALVVAPEQLVASIGTSGDASVALAVDRFGRAYVAWTGEHSLGSPTATIWVAHGAPNALGKLAFGAPIRASAQTGTYQYRPAIAANESGAFVVAWSDERSADHDVYWRRGRLTGAGQPEWVMSDERRVNQETEGAQVSPSVALDEAGTAYVAWGQQRGTERRRIYVAKSGRSDLMVDLIAEVEAGGDSDQNFPSLVVAGPEVTIAFGDNRRCRIVTSTACQDTGGDLDGVGATDVYVARSLDGGTSFGSVLRLNDDVGDGSAEIQHGRASVVVDDVGRVYAAWTDDRAGASQVFLTRAE